MRRISSVMFTNINLMINKLMMRRRKNLHLPWWLLVRRGFETSGFRISGPRYVRVVLSGSFLEVEKAHGNIQSVASLMAFDSFRYLLPLPRYVKGGF